MKTETLPIALNAHELKLLCVTLYAHRELIVSQQLLAVSDPSPASQRDADRLGILVEQTLDLYHKLAAAVDQLEKK